MLSTDRWRVQMAKLSKILNFGLVLEIVQGEGGTGARPRLPPPPLSLLDPLLPLFSLQDTSGNRVLCFPAGKVTTEEWLVRNVEGEVSLRFFFPSKSLSSYSPPPPTLFT
ncbi:hypothetical protein J6590_073588 [Homalodisca vitripennis]|nr:hypothetical protein J6590_073588 [Homalodisca vitripennis]